MYFYSVKLEQDTDTGSYLASCRDLPLFNSVGDSIIAALKESVDGLRTAIEIEIEQKRQVPPPSPPLAGEYQVNIPIIVSLQAALHNALLESGLSYEELSQKMGLSNSEIEKLFDVSQPAGIDSIERAFTHIRDNG
jgi:antitoxin HicB